MQSGQHVQGTEDFSRTYLPAALEISSESCAVVLLSLSPANFPKSKEGLILYYSLFTPNQQISFSLLFCR